MQVTHVIRNEAEHSEALDRMAEIFHAQPGTPEHDELMLLALLVEAYEEEHFPIPPPTPVGAIQFYMDQKGLEPKDLVPFLGDAVIVSRVLSGQQELSKAMILRLHKGLGIPLECLFETED